MKERWRQFKFRCWLHEGECMMGAFLASLATLVVLISLYGDK